MPLLARLVRRRARLSTGGILRLSRRKTMRPARRPNDSTASRSPTSLAVIPVTADWEEPAMIDRICNRSIATVFGLVILGAGCTMSSEERAERAARRAQYAREDFRAENACRELNRLLRDTTDGLVTTAEFRGRVQRIYEEQARRADDAKSPGVEPAARRLLAAATSGTTAETLVAIKAFQEACRAAPWRQDQR